MKQTLIAIALLSFTGLFAQEPVKGIDDIDKFAAITDSTIQTRPDTAFWRFYADTLYRQLPNGVMRPIPVYQGELIVWRGGQRYVNRSTGILTWRDFVEYGRKEIQERNAEIGIIRDGMAAVILFRDQWRDFINEQRNAR